MAVRVKVLNNRISAREAQRVAIHLAGDTHEAISRRAGCSRVTITHAASGKTTLGTDTLFAIVAAYRDARPGMEAAVLRHLGVVGPVVAVAPSQRDMHGMMAVRLAA